jgi:Peptidase family C25
MRYPIWIASALALLCAGAVLAPSAVAGSSPTRHEQQWSIVSGTAVKLLVNRTAWTRVGRQQLVAAGLTADTPTKTLRLYADGRQVPIRVVGTSHGVLARKGAIEFYGVAEDTASTDTRVYWLVWGSSDATSKRIGATRGRARSGGVAQSFAATSIVAPTDRYYQLNTDAKDDSDHFYGPTILPGTAASEDISTVDPAPYGAPSITVRLQGYSLFDHRVRVKFNGSEVGTVTWHGDDSATARFRLDRSLVHAGSNTVALEAIGGQLDYSLFDWAKLTYARLYQADGDRLAFSLPARRVARVTGFTGRRLRVVDVTVPSSPRLVSATVRSASDGYTLTVPSSAKRRQLIAFASRLTRRPAGVVRNKPSSWYRNGQGADEVMISAPEFIPALRPLVELRERQGLRVVVVNVQKLYDEFSFGAHDPDAIRAFLERARVAWKPAPRYVLLVGDATVDPRNYLKLNDPDFVPTELVKTYYLRAPSDDSFADFNDDGVPEMAVGRLPVDSPAQAAAVVAKVVRYESTSVAGPRSALLVADKNEGFDFEGSATGLASLLHPAATTQILMRSQSASNAAFRTQVEEGLNAGPSVVEYIGHGSIDRWGAGSYLPPTDAKALHNERLSIYVVTTCLNGYFVDPSRLSIGEAALEGQPGGAVAVWASSALSDGGLDLNLNQALLGRLYDGGTATLGEKVIAAKRSVQDSEVRRSMVLLGDPATRVR